MKYPLASLALAILPVAVACSGDDGDGGATALFLEDYAATYQEVRNCRATIDHGFGWSIRVLADPAALGPYQNRTDPFPEGAVVLKEEYDSTDCSGEVARWSVMVKLAEGADPDNLDWHWQLVDAEREVVEDNAPRCAGCHTGCGVPPTGYDGTCTEVSPGG